MLIQKKYTCSNCNKPDIDFLEIFPGDICKECHEVKFDKQAQVFEGLFGDQNNLQSVIITKTKPKTIKASQLAKSMGISFTQL